MGIRFYCPNGHKLNVKEFLAGQRGICPRCGVSVNIPLESTRAAGTKDLPIAAEWEARARKEGKLPGKKNFQSTISKENPSPKEIADDSIPDLNELFQENEAAVSDPSDWKKPTPVSNAVSSAVVFSEMETPAKPTPPDAPEIPNVPKLPDPFEGPADTVWYVRPTAGGQYGPVDREIIKVWLSEGRIVKDTLVWREGWEDWKRGDEVFEALVPPLNAPPVVSTPAQPQDKKRFFW